MITVRKLKILIDGENRNESYKFIRDSIYAQYLALNKAMSYLGTAYLSRDKEIFKEAIKSLNNSNPIFDNINFGKGIDTKSSVNQTVKKHIQADIKNGLAKGERSIRNYKRDYPLMTRGRDLKFYYSDTNLTKVKVKWVNGIIFDIILGKEYNKNDLELRSFLNQVINKEYKISQSSICFDKHNRLILNLSVNITDNTPSEIVKGKIVGVDLGMKIPAYVTLNDSEYIGKSIGDINDFLKVRKQFKERKERLQKQLAINKGGKGRVKKMQLMDAFTDKEKNFANTYNHGVSKAIINFAKKYKAEQINVEFLALADSEKEILSSTIRYWSYYQLQQMIEYKANREGITVKYVDPYLTSQTCSKCGNYEVGQRINQELFECKLCGNKMNADRNASFNIARSTKYISSKEESDFYKQLK